METFHESILAALRAARDRAGSASALAEQCGVKTATVSRWLTGERSPSVREVGKVFDALGIRFDGLPRAEAGKDVCFVNARGVPAGEGAAPPVAEDYIAAPLVGEVGAGPGYLPEGDIKSWFLVYKHLPAIRYRRNLIAVEIGPDSTSMQPTLNPGDIVLVDRDDRDVTKPGRIMLVLDPVDASGMIKRVNVADRKHDVQIAYYSDNGAKWPPLVYSLRQDFAGDWDKAIVGRAIWVWSDVREK